jgi:hypothetical protein
MVGMYREGMSLRAVAAMQGVSQTTVASCLEKAGQWRRRTQEENQRRWPRVRRVCATCDEPFAVRQGHLARGRSRSGNGDLGLYCSRACWNREQQQRASEIGAQRPLPTPVACSGREL